MYTKRSNRLVHQVTMRSFVITVYGQCCRRHVVGQQVVSDVRVQSNQNLDYSNNSEVMIVGGRVYFTCNNGLSADF